jgi:D-sedoheptulose 7-phosphate isomerase
MRELINKAIQDNIQVATELRNKTAGTIEQAASMIVRALENGKKLLICGNGGSAADSQHFAAEIVGRFYMNRKALPAVSLTTDTSIITAVANDFGYEEVFARQVEALGNEGDIFIGISTSGNSANVLRAMKKAAENHLSTIALVGQYGGKLSKVAQCSISIPSDDTPRIQEGHALVIHILCQITEDYLFKKGTIS